jgi:hypothetical protein
MRFKDLLVMRLELHEFAALELDDRLDVLWQYGTLIAHVKTRSRGYALYALFGYYVEMQVNRAKVITAAVAFKRGDKLDKYLPQVDLSDLFSNA